jgi:TatA/E family protein of Tat protein translocase|tara:strand:+ start:5739 stop:5945 length:207 start_codon:yes stop_codon:yes gene_type:complete
MIGTTEIVILVIIAIIIFGANRIPELARNVGRAKGEFQAGMAEVATPSKAEADMDRGGMTEEVAAENE